MKHFEKTLHFQQFEWVEPMKVMTGPTCTLRCHAVRYGMCNLWTFFMECITISKRLIFYTCICQEICSTHTSIDLSPYETALSEITAEFLYASKYNFLVFNICFPIIRCTSKHITILHKCRSLQSFCSAKKKCFIATCYTFSILQDFLSQNDTYYIHQGHYFSRLLSFAFHGCWLWT